MEIKNAVTVHRVWGDLSDGDLLMACQYESNALAFCKAQIDSEPEGCSLIYVNHYDGKLMIFKKVKP